MNVQPSWSQVVTEGAHVPVDTGYDVRAVNQKDTPKPNGWLSFADKEVPMWVFDVTVPQFELAGETAQSARTRSFFPRNAVQPAVIVAAQFPNQAAYARVAELVRLSHRQMAQGILPKLEIMAGNPNGSSIHTNNKYGFGREIVAGKPNHMHQPLSAWGYVTRIRREHTRFNYSPEMQFEFTIYRWESPTSWADSETSIRVLSSWKKVFENIIKKDRNILWQQDDDTNAIANRRIANQKLTDTIGGPAI